MDQIRSSYKNSSFLRLIQIMKANFVVDLKYQKFPNSRVVQKIRIYMVAEKIILN